MTTRDSAVRAIALTLAVASFQAGHAQPIDAPPPSRLAIAPGQAPHDAVRQSLFAEHIAGLRTAWAAAHPVPLINPAPVIKSGTILTPTLNAQVAPAAPEISVTYKTGVAGLKYLTFYLQSQTSQQYLVSSYFQAIPSSSGTVVLQNVGSGLLSRYAAAGDWSISSINLVDGAGNYMNYTGPELAKLFPSLTVTVTNARSPDAKNPSVASGTLYTPSISLSGKTPHFQARLAVSDNLSGVTTAYVVSQTPGSPVSFLAYASPPAPVTKGAIDVYRQFLSTDPVGTYTITQYEVCDAAQNCLIDATPADIQSVFGTTTYDVTK